MPHNETYDVIIIGAGISGLVCGAYLAKAGMKVLIVEQHDKPGGYCTSFKRKGFTFDAAAHSFGGYRKNGNLRKILDDLAIDAQIERYDPSDIIVTPDTTVSFFSDTAKTIQQLQESFPESSAKILSFFNFIQNASPIDYIRLRSQSFKTLLDEFFSDTKLKALLALPVLGNGGLPPSHISAFTASKIFLEFLLDGGYYPKGGMQKLADGLTNRFLEFGGHLRLSTKVCKIRTNNSSVSGVIINDGTFFNSKIVVGNCDARQIFLDLIAPGVVGELFRDKLLQLQPSLSVFVVYCGLQDQIINTYLKAGTNTWFIRHYDLEAIYSGLNEKIMDHSLDGFMVRVSPEGNTLQAFINAPFISREYWIRNKSVFVDKFLSTVEAYLPGLSSYIVYKEGGSPHTMQRYTLNHNGAAYGWASLPAQMFDPDFSSKPSIKNLYLAGHWTTQSQGVPGVAYVGHLIAKKIAKEYDFVL